MKTETQEQEKLKAAAAIYEKAIAGDEIEPQKCPLDEVAAAYIATLRVENYADLGYEFGGYKIGAIYSYILSVLNDSIYKFNTPAECEARALFAEKVGK